MIVIQNLDIKPINQEDYAVAGPVVQSWIKEADDAQKKASQNEAVHFHACKLLSQGLLEYFQTKKSAPPSQAYVYKDWKGIMVLFRQEDYLYLDLLVVHPCKIFSKSGIGSALLEYAENEVVKLNKQYISLAPLPSSESFYEKKGYKNQLTHMVKTAEKIQEEIATKRLAA